MLAAILMIGVIIYDILWREIDDMYLKLILRRKKLEKYRIFHS